MMPTSSSSINRDHYAILVLTLQRSRRRLGSYVNQVTVGEKGFPPYPSNKIRINDSPVKTHLVRSKLILLCTATMNMALWIRPIRMMVSQVVH